MRGWTWGGGRTVPLPRRELEVSLVRQTELSEAVEANTQSGAEAPAFLTFSRRPLLSAGGSALSVSLQDRGPVQQT